MIDRRIQPLHTSLFDAASVIQMLQMAKAANLHLIGGMRRMQRQGFVLLMINDTHVVSRLYVSCIVCRLMTKSNRDRPPAERRQPVPKRGG